jgi:hypothetical protein
MLLNSFMKNCFIPPWALTIRTANLTSCPGRNARSFPTSCSHQVLVFFLLSDLLPAHVKFCWTGKLNKRDGLDSEIQRDDVRLSRREVSGRGKCVVPVNVALHILHDRTGVESKLWVIINYSHNRVMPVYTKGGPAIGRAR